MVEGRKNARPLCSVEGCNDLHAARGMCRVHYDRWRRKGVVSADIPLRLPFGPSTCQVDYCGIQAVGRGMCRKHYNRWHRGKLEAPSVESDRIRERRRCSWAGCSQQHYGRGFCVNHYDWVRAREAGTPHRRSGEDHEWWTGEEASYRAAHIRLARERGKALEYSCVDCDSPGDEWSYMGGAPDERIGEYEGKWMPYSLDQSFYVPRCKSCHVTFDKYRDRKVS